MGNIGTTVAAQKAKFRRQFGVLVTPATGPGLWMRTRSLEKSEHTYLPEGIANAADADLRVFEASPVDFTDPKNVLTMPVVGSLWTWHGVSYTMLAVQPGDDEIGGVMITLLLFVYKKQVSEEAVPVEATEQIQQDDIWKGRQV